MPNEFIARNGIVSRGNLVVSGSVTSTSPASFSGSLSVTGSIASTNNIQGNQFSSTVGSVIGGRYFSDVLIAAGTITYGSYSTTNVANLDIYANNANVGNGALLRLSSRFGGDNGAYLVSSLTGSVVLAVNGTGNSGLVLNGSTMNVGIGSSTPTAKLHVVGSGATSSTTSLLVQDSNGNTSLQVKDDKTTTFGAPIYLSGNQGYIYYSANDYIQFPRQGGPAPGYFNTSTAGDGWAFRLATNNQTYARIMEGSFYLEAYTPNSNGRNSIKTWFSGSNFVYIDGDGVTGNSPSYGNGVNIIIRGGKSGTYSNIDNRGAAGYVTVEGGSAVSSSFTTHVPAAGVNIQTGLGLGTGSAADLTFSTSTTSSVASTYHTQTQRMIIKGQTGFVGVGTSSPSASFTVGNTDVIFGSNAGYGFYYGAANDGTFQVKPNGSQTEVWLRPAGNSQNFGSAYWSSLQTSAASLKVLSGQYGDLYLGSGVYTLLTIYNPTSGAGHVGIGTTTPHYKLQVAGTAYSGSFNANDQVVINTAGNMGVGTTAPTARLQVKGSGATSSTTSLLVQNANASASLSVLDDGTNAIVSSNELPFTVSHTNGSSALGFVLGNGSQLAAGFTALRLNNSLNVFTFSSGRITTPLPLTVGGPTDTFRISGGGGGSSVANPAIALTDNTYNAGGYTVTSGTQTTVQIGGFGAPSNSIWKPASGTANYTLLAVTPNMSGSGTYSGTIRGIYYNPTVDSTTYGAHRAIETTAGDVVFNGGNVGIGTTAPSSKLHVVGNTILSGSAGSGSALLAYKSGSTVLDIQGSQGQLFSVIDALSGSLMSVNDISGLPILEVFSDDRVVMGTYGAPAVTISGSNTVISGSLRGRVVTLSTASATASMDCSLSNFFDLTLSGSMYLTPTNILPGETINLRITQPATSGSLNYTSSIKFPNGLPYTASATSSVVDLISFISFDSTTLYATAIKNLV